MSKNRRRVLGSCAILVGMLLLAELAVRARAWVKYGSMLEIYDVYQPHPDADLMMGRPGLSVLFAREYRIDFDSRGFRSPELEMPKPADVVRLAFLGGSTTFSAQARSTEETWPARATAALNEMYASSGLRFDHVNAGVTGSSVADSTLCVRHRLAEIEPDVIVIYHAAKDLADDTRRLALQQGLVEETDESRLEEASLLWMLVRKNLRHRARQAQGRGEGPKLRTDLQACAEAFGGRMATLLRAAGEAAPLVVVLSFATKARADQPTEEQIENLEQAFTFMPYMTPQGILEGYAAYNEAIRRVGTDGGAIVVGGEAQIPGTSEFFHDSVHFTSAGYERMAARLVDGLASEPRFQALLDARAEAGR